MEKTGNNVALVPTIQETNESLFRTNDDGLFNASSLAREYGRDVYGYTRGKRIKDIVRDICMEYELDPELEFTNKGNIVRVTSVGTAQGTWMHLDLFIKFLGWLDPKLERTFLKNAIAARNNPPEDILQIELAALESETTKLKRKLAQIPIYKQLKQKEKQMKLLQFKIERRDRSIRKEYLNQQKKAIQ